MVITILCNDEISFDAEPSTCIFRKIKASCHIRDGVNNAIIYLCDFRQTVRPLVWHNSVRRLAMDTEVMRLSAATGHVCYALLVNEPKCV